MKSDNQNPVQNNLFPTHSTYLSNEQLRQGSKQFDLISKTRLSKNFILRDFLYSTDSEYRGISNIPEDIPHVINCSKALCEHILEPILNHWGKFFITFGYQSKAGIEADWSAAKRKENPIGSHPHQFDRGTFGSRIYARIDIWPICVEDGLVSKNEFGHWLMHNLDIDLLQQFKRSNIYCITYSEFRPRRVWIEWGRPEKGEPKRETFMGADYWQNVWPSLPEHERPKFGPSQTGGSIQWSKANV